MSLFAHAPPLPPTSLLVNAAQPYQTRAGPALAVNFLYQPCTLPFQHLPFTHSAVAPAYYHALLHALASFAATPRPVRESGLKIRQPPKTDFWAALGTLNCFYQTHYTNSATHPAMGAVELVRPSHRPENDVKLTLYDTNYHALSVMNITGPNDRLFYGDLRVAETVTNMDAAQRGALPYVAPPVGEAAYAETPVTLGPEQTPIYGGLYDDLVYLGGRSGGFAQRACCRRGDHMTRMQDKADDFVVPPWVLYSCVTKLFLRLRSHPTVSEKLDDYISLPWYLASHQSVHAGDVAFDEPFDMVSSTVKVVRHYRTPPWRREVGLPALDGNTPCAILRAEIRQRGLVLLAGTFFFTTAPEQER